MYLRPVRFASFHDLAAVGDVRGHRHGAGHVFAGLERRKAHPGVVRNRGVDVNDIDVAVLEQCSKIRVTLLDAKVFSDGVELFLVALADRVAVGVWVLLPQRDELGPEAEPDDGDVDLLGHGRVLLKMSAGSSKL